MPYLGLLCDDQVFETLLVCVLHTQHGTEHQAPIPAAPTTSCLPYYLLFALLPWTWTILLLSGCSPLFCPLMTNVNV